MKSPNKLLNFIIAVAIFSTSFGIIQTATAQTAITPKNPLPKSPWQSHTKIAANNTSAVYLREWRKSATKSCPILAIPNISPVHLPSATPRAANFSTGWGVAYDLRNYNGKALRSAYGVANAGKTSLSKIHTWNYKSIYQDKSFVTLGHEGDNPKGKYLAYLVMDNGCFYNVWSQIGEAHLKKVIDGLRYVKS